MVAAFAESPTRVDGIGFIRDKESDRVAGPVTELRRAGVDAEEHDDGFVIRPAGLPNPPPSPPTTITEWRWRSRSSGSSSPASRSATGLLAKTFPGFFQALDQLR